MTKNNDDTTSLPPTPQTNLSPQKKQNSQRKLWRYLSLITLVFIATSAYTIFMQQRLHKLQTVFIQQTQTRFENINQQHTVALNELNQKVSALRNTLEQKKGGTNHWLLLEARYYLELASINALWTDNSQTTIALLQQTDALLAKIHDQRIFSIRQTIAKEIVENTQFATFDITGLLSQLDAIQHALTNLPFKKSVALLVNNADTAPAPNKGPLSAWQNHLHTTLLHLEKLIVIRHHDEAIQPLLTPAYESMLRENIRLNLQTAQWAVLQRQQTVYQIALKQTIENIQRGFDIKNISTQSLIEQIQKLQLISWTQTRPTITESLSELNRVIEKPNETVSQSPGPAIKSTSSGETSL